MNLLQAANAPTKLYLKPLFIGLKTCDFTSHFVKVCSVCNARIVCTSFVVTSSLQHLLYPFLSLCLPLYQSLSTAITLSTTLPPFIHLFQFLPHYLSIFISLSLFLSHSLSLSLSLFHYLSFYLYYSLNIYCSLLLIIYVNIDKFSNTGPLVTFQSFLVQI